jgi:SAM-dependent methyltransferase
MKTELINDIIGWDTSNWSKSLDYWSQKIDVRNKNYNCLEIGAEQGGLSLWLALNGNKVLCTDYSYFDQPHILQKAKKMHRKYNCERKISYQPLSALEIPYENYFDIILFKSVLGGIGANKIKDVDQLVINQIYKALKPGGKLLFAENTAASLLHKYSRKWFVRWSEEWNYSNLKDMVKLFSSYKTFDYKTVGFLGTFGRNEKQRIFLGKIDALCDSLIPKSNRYIVMGVAEK